MDISTKHASPNTILLLITSSGFAALSWEVLWQIKTTMAIGISAFSTALTLAIVMGGMSLGGYCMGTALRHRSEIQAIRLYGVLELIAGCCGLLLNTAFLALEKMDSLVYAGAPGMISLVNIIGVMIVIGIPSLCMGATLPVFGLIARQFQLPLTKLYSLNTFGAAASVLMVAFMLIPLLGMTHTIWLIAMINIIVGCYAWQLTASPAAELPAAPSSELQPILFSTMFLIFITGFATFVLEVAWFRSMTSSVLPNTTDAFAMLLFCMLIAIGVAAKRVPVLKKKNKLLGTQICLAAILILLITPLIERLDYIFIFYKQMLTTAFQLGIIDQNEPFLQGSDLLVNTHTWTVSWVVILLYGLQQLIRVLVIGMLIIPPVCFLGAAFPWMLDDLRNTHHIGKLYAINTLGAIVGSITAAWILLPTIGFAKTAWIAGLLVLAAGIVITPGLKRFFYAALGIAAFVFAMHFETGIGKLRAQGFYASDMEGNIARVVEFFEGPDATVATVEYNDGARTLLINSVAAAWEAGSADKPSSHYMAWMGHLPMLLHPEPKDALVICFGTGQTSNAVRKENPEHLDIVDVNANVFKLGHHFRSNENVLNDPRVKKTVMDGRAYLRRIKKNYDIITLEPMPPSAAGVNALYSREFYLLAQKRLRPHGIIAQWLPFHIVDPHYTASIAKTFIDVFPNAILWIDQTAKTGILLGINDDTTKLAAIWPGFKRANISRNLSPQEIQQNVMLHADELREYGKYGDIITDDNQLLAYGKALYASGLMKQNYDLLRRVNKAIPEPYVSLAYQ